MKNWILNLRFVKKALAEAEKQGGIKAFPLAQKDILETMADDLNEKAEELAKQKLNDLLVSVDLHKIVTLNKTAGLIYIGGEKAEDGRLANLRSQAEFILNSEIWQLLKETPKSLAERSMFISGESIEDLRKGRSILYTLSSQQNILDILKNYTPRKPLALQKEEMV